MSALQAEWTKLRSLRSTTWALLAIVGSTVAIGVVSASSNHPDVVPNEDVVTITLAGVYLAQVAAVAFGVVAICSEYATGTIRTTFAANPRRRHVVVAKAVIVATLGLAACALAAVAAFYLGLAVLHGNGFTSDNGYPAPSLSDGDTLREVGVAAVYPVLIALLSLGVATIVRHTALAISAVLGALFVPFIVAPLFPEHIGNTITFASPMAGMAAQEQGAPGDPLTGVAVTVAWVVGAMLLALWLIARRDA
jgi:ABC-2 type transport system permease protein